MHLRSGYETPPEFGAWKYEPDEYDSDTDTKKHVFDTTKAVTSQSRGQVPYDQNVYVSGTQAEKVPSWVPATLPSCVPGPRPNQPVQPPSSSSQTNMSNIAGNNNPQSSGAMHFPLTPSTPSNNLDQELPLVPGHVFPFSGNNPDAVVDPFTMGFAGSHLPPQPLEGGAGSFFDFNFQAPLPTGVPDFELDLDLDLDLGLSMAMDLGMDPTAFSLPGDAFMPMNGGSGHDNGNGNPHGTINSNAENIPLKCYLCPGTQTFSDVSHLLTHISSKSHLAVRFRIGLSDSDEDKQRILDFDNWAAQYGINRLLKSRQDAKDQKKQGQQQKRQRATGSQRKARYPSAAAARVSTAPIVHDSVKTEADDDIHTQMDYNLLALNQNSWHRHTPRNTSLDDAYHTPSSNRSRSVYPLPDSPQALAPQNNEVSSSGSGAKTLKLKGAVYPGMDLFDSADSDGQRTRNQRKHVSVLNKMILTSQSIQRDEWQWDNSMSTIKRKKDVYDSPSDFDDSPDSKHGEDNQPVKRRARRAAPQNTSSERQNRVTTRSSKVGSKRRADRKITKTEHVSDSDEEFPKRRGLHGLGVFDDNAGDDSLGGDVFGGRRQFAQDMPGSLFRGQQSSVPYRNAMQGLPSNRPMSSMFDRPDNQRVFGWLDKENGRSAASAFPSQQPNPNDIANFYTQLRQNAPTGGLNPLCVQRQDNSAYLFGQGFDTTRSTTTAGFPAIHGIGYNIMNNGMGLGLGNGIGNMGNMGDNVDNGPHFQSGNGFGQNNNFDV